MKESMPILVRGDARRLPLPDESVDVVCTSPPYFGLRDYGTPGQIGAEPSPCEFIASLIEATREMVRVLKPSGSIFVNLGDRYAASRRGPDGSSSRLTNGEQERSTLPSPRFDAPTKSLLLLPERYRIACADELSLIPRAVVIWSKTNGLPESVTDRVRRSHEDWVHLTKRPRYFCDIDAIREPHAIPLGGRTPRPFGTNNATPRHRSATDNTGWKNHDVAEHPMGRLPGSVWEVSTQPLKVPESLGVDHHAAFPMEWPRQLIRGWCPPGGTALDPFGGTGTTALVATMLGRTGISVELSEDYQRIARWRCSDPKERARAAGLDAAQVSHIAPSIPGQSSLFDTEAAS